MDSEQFSGFQDLHKLDTSSCAKRIRNLPGTVFVSQLYLIIKMQLFSLSHIGSDLIKLKTILVELCQAQRVEENKIFLSISFFLFLKMLYSLFIHSSAVKRNRIANSF